MLAIDYAEIRAEMRRRRRPCLIYRGVPWSLALCDMTGGKTDRYHRAAEPWIIERLIDMYVAGWSTMRRSPSAYSGGCASVPTQGMEGEQDGGDEAADGRRSA
jgi:hypothetical protein